MQNETKPSNPPAFPNTDPACFGASDAYGMDLRDYFAAKFSVGESSKYGRFLTPKDMELIARGSYMLADAMLKAREVDNG